VSEGVDSVFLAGILLKPDSIQQPQE